MTTTYYHGVGMKDGVRCPFDRYETPDSVTFGLLKRIELPYNVREPACGTGRIARCLATDGHSPHATDLQEDEVDFLEETRKSQAIVTNPPYREGLADAFIHKAHQVCDGPIWMLLNIGMLFGQSRCSELWSEFPVQKLIVVSRRIKFFRADGTRIVGQAHNHAWFGWNVEPGPTEWIPPEELQDAV